MNDKRNEEFIFALVNAVMNNAHFCDGRTVKIRQQSLINAVRKTVEKYSHER